MLYLLILLGFVFFAGVAMTINEGLWSNTILLICLLISGILAFIAGVPLGTMLTEKMELAAEHTWYGVFAGVWGAFVVAMLLLRVSTDKASKVRVRYLPLVDKIGGILMGLFVALMFTSFAAYTFERVPINAEVWKQSDASATQLDYFARLRNPFRVVLKNFTKTEQVDSPFFGE